MVSNAAQLIIKEAEDRGVDLYHLHEHVCIQINDTHPTMVIPELIRILTEEKNFNIDTAVDVVSKSCAYTNHTILAEEMCIRDREDTLFHTGRSELFIGRNVRLSLIHI